MLSLKDFKKYEISEYIGLEKIVGGITCKGVIEVMVQLYNAQSPQYDNVVHQLQNGGIQCTDGSGNLYNMQM